MKIVPLTVELLADRIVGVVFQFWRCVAEVLFSRKFQRDARSRKLPRGTSFCFESHVVPSLRVFLSTLLTSGRRSSVFEALACT
jgi:hypothetical protein